MNKIQVLLLCVVIALLGCAQATAAIVYGKVTEAGTGEVLIGVHVWDETTRRGTVTDEYGRYRLALERGGHSLRVSYVGHETKRLQCTIEGDTLLNFLLLNQEQLNEVVVEEQAETLDPRYQHIGATDIPLEQMQSTPTLFGEADLLKTIQREAGVQHGVAGTSGLLVRGGESDQNLYLLDGTPLYDVAHAFGFVSAFQQEAIKKVEFYKSSFPACYGGRVSSVVDIRTKDGDKEHFHGGLSVGLLTSHLHLEGPVVRDRTSFIVTAHRSYVDALMRPWLDEGSKAGYAMYDVNAKVTHWFNERVRLIASYYQGQDALHYGNEYTSKQVQSDDDLKRRWGNQVGSIRLVSMCNARLFNNTYFSYSAYRTQTVSKMSDSNSWEEMSQRSSSSNEATSVIRDCHLASDFDYHLSETLRLKFGGRWSAHLFEPHKQVLRHSYSAQNEQYSSHSIHRNANIRYSEGNLYAEGWWTPTDRWVTQCGLHGTLTRTQGKTYLSLQPRLSVAHSVASDTWVTAAYSRMQQTVHRLSATDIVLPQDYWVPVTRQIPPMTASQYSLGVQSSRWMHWTLSCEAYYKDIRHLLDYKDGHLNKGYREDWEKDVAQGKGRCYGYELSAKYLDKRLTCVANYTWAKSTRRFADGSVNQGREFMSHFDRRHTANVYTLFPVGKRLDFYVEWQYASGHRITVPTGYVQSLVPAIDHIDYWREGGVELEPEHQETLLWFTERNNYRLPASHQLNVGMNLRRTLKHSIRTLNVSVMNVYNHRNPDLVTIDSVEREGEEKLRLKKITLLPILPSVSYQIRF